MSQFPILGGKLQGDLDGNGFTINDLDLTGLGLTKASVGLGNVDNTSDLDKPLSTAAIAALAGKESTIAAGTETQYWRGDKTWQELGALALQGGNTTLQLISVIGPNNTSAAILQARRNDYLSGGQVNTAIKQLGASTTGTVLTSVSAANAGMLIFDGSSNGIIKTTIAAPLRFGTSGVERVKILQGLMVGAAGALADPGAGSIACSNNISATGTILAGGAIGGASAVVAGTALIGGAVTLSTTLHVLGAAVVGGALSINGVLSTANNFTAVGNILGLGILSIAHDVLFPGLPTGDPHVVGKVWNDSGRLMISAG